MIGTILGALVFGIILGPLARLILPGKQRIGVLWTILSGAAGALVGGLIANATGFVDLDDEFDWIRILIQLACAALAVAVVSAAKGSDRPSSPPPARR